MQSLTFQLARLVQLGLPLQLLRRLQPLQSLHLLSLLRLSDRLVPFLLLLGTIPDFAVCLSVEDQLGRGYLRHVRRDMYVT
jgi:hypothetical protein